MANEGKSFNINDRGMWARVVLGVVVCAPALWHLWLVTKVFLGRYDYPFDMDWLESSALYQSWRMMNGQYTYSTPDRGYLPLFHPIGYPAMLAAVGKVTGLSYGMARILSFAAFLTTIGISSAEVVRHATRDRVKGYTLALLSAGTAGACLPLCHGFYDLIRCDTLSWMFCAIAAAIASKDKLSNRRIAWLALVMTAGVYVRLLTVFPCAWVGLVVLFRDWRAGARLAVYVIGGCGAVLAALSWTSDGWYFTYTVTLLQRHTVHMDRMMGGAERFLDFVPFAPALPVVGLALAFTKRMTVRTAMWLGVFVMSVPAALLPFAKDGGFDNDYMPIGLFVGPAAALLIIEVGRALKPRALASLAPYVLGACLGAFLILRPYAVSDFVPSAEHWQRAARLNEMVAGLEGGVVAPCHPFLPIQNGHTNDQFSEMPYIDAFWSKLPGLDLGRYLDETEADWILLTGFEQMPTLRLITERYEDGQMLTAMPTTTVGQGMRLRYMLRRNRPRTNERVLFDFEADSENKWEAIGTAFEHSPTSARPKWQAKIWGVTGQQVANSYHPKLGDRAMGKLVSEPFIVDRNRLSVSVGGGVGVGVHLVVDGRAVKGAYPMLSNRELLVSITMDVTQYRGREATLKLFDNNTGFWGHVVVDNVVLYDEEPSGR